MKIENSILTQVESKDIKNGTFTIPDSVTSIGDGAYAVTGENIEKWLNYQPKGWTFSYNRQRFFGKNS